MNNTCEINLETNIVTICGLVKSTCMFSHRTYGENFYTFTVGVSRNSGYEDQIVIMASERITYDIDMEVGRPIKILGQIRTYNEEVDGHNKLNIVVFAKEILCPENGEEHINEIHLVGFICKKPKHRISPLGRKICDMMLAVNRLYNKSDYIPCIAWGRNALFAESMEVGDKISIIGRLQSRQYKKKISEDEVICKTAYEVSILQLETIPMDVV